MLVLLQLVHSSLIPSSSSSAHELSPIVCCVFGLCNLMLCHLKHIASDYKTVLQATCWVEKVVCVLHVGGAWILAQVNTSSRPRSLFCPNNEVDRTRSGLELNLKRSTEIELSTIVIHKICSSQPSKVWYRTLVVVNECYPNLLHQTGTALVKKEKHLWLNNI